MAKYQKPKNTKSRFQKKHFSVVQILIISIILFLFLIITLFIIFRLVHTTQNLVESKVTYLAKDYYENHIYEELAKQKSETAVIEALKQHETTGLSVVYLRQLLYLGDKADKDMIEYLSTHCDINKTHVKYYPEPPFSKTSYRVDYVYSCDF